MAAHLSPDDVYESDLRNLLGAQFVLAHVGAPSSGVGAELAISAMSGLPVVAVWSPGEVVSRFLLGMLRRNQAIELIAADLELAERLPEALRQMVAQGCARETMAGAPLGYLEGGRGHLPGL